MGSTASEQPLHGVAVTREKTFDHEGHVVQAVEENYSSQIEETYSHLVAKQAEVLQRRSRYDLKGLDVIEWANMVLIIVNMFYVAANASAELTSAVKQIG